MVVVNDLNGIGLGEAEWCGVVVAGCWKGVVLERKWIENKKTKTKQQQQRSWFVACGGGYVRPSRGDGSTVPPT